MQASAAGMASAPVIRGVLLALAAALLFGLVNVAARASTLPPLVLGGSAYLLSGAVLAATLRGMRIDRRDWPRVLVMSLVGGAVAPALLFLGLDHATASDASILLTLELVFTAILAAIFLRERPRPLAWVGVGLLFASALLVAVATRAAGGATTAWGAALVALAALGWGVDNVVSTRLVAAYKPHHLLAVKGLIGGSAAFLAAILAGNSLAIPASEVRTVAYIGILGVGASILLYYHALRRIGATLASGLFLPMTALAGVLGGWILLGEALTPVHAGAGALALGGILLASAGPAEARR